MRWRDGVAGNADRPLSKRPRQPRLYDGFADLDASASQPGRRPPGAGSFNLPKLDAALRDLVHPAQPRRSAPEPAPSEPLEDAALLRRLLRAKDHMDAASHEAWPVSRLAQVSGVSEAYFARSFKRAFGLPPHRYLLTRRIEQAVSLLRDTELGITDIAFATGWQSLGTFGRIFHDITGFSPSALRREVRAKMPELGRVPACLLKASQRPDLGTAVLEKRRRMARDTLAAPTKEKP